MFKKRNIMNLTFTRLKTQELDFDIFPLGITVIRNDYGSGIIFGLLFFVFYVGFGENLKSISFSYEEETDELETEEQIIDERGSD